MSIESGRAGYGRMVAAVSPVVLGASIVIGISLLERLVTDLLHQQAGGQGPPQPINFVNVANWISSLGLNLPGSTQQELENFIRLRHCFAHEYGRVTARQEPAIRQFLNDLSSSRVLDQNNQPIPPYYTIVADRSISLEPAALGRFRQVVVAVLRELSARGYI